ncbi:DUF262 domain-containing HNH endonuclease family protein [Actinobacillus genomosp. 2]|uniref:DUF262 domain-containing protein n=1 Tax=Actinobacillus genomosp. 2 TaxID=230709 RepID=UPI002442B37A|nr:DUF262 domain-containing HNH endonuclease family protein [Actinobacillus genomosp. 2]WGE32170.1 DUF262 domain-containing HNH endonuclease family protein [Actinobacillus genomosp. 2]
MIESAAKTTVSALLSKNDSGTEFFYTIPPYQREYAWNKNQWDNLFDDLMDNDEGYFIGSLICILGEKNEAIVIDGQQRLTTLNLLLLAIYYKLEELYHNQKFTANKSYLRKFLSTQEFFSYNEKIRLTPSIQNNNQKDYFHLVNKVVNEDKNNPPTNYGNRRIAKAFSHFKKRVEEHVEESIDKLFSLLDKVTSACVVRIDTKDEASAFTLFESINNRGIPLTPMDLIKNSMISNLKSQDAEKTNQQWQNIVKNLNDYDIQVRYLRHFYQAFRPTNLIFDATKGKDKITKNELIQIYTNAIKQKPEDVLKELTKKAITYQVLSFPEEITSDNQFIQYQDKLIDLRKLGIAPAYTLLLFLFEQYPMADFTTLLNYLEQWFIARHLTNVPASNSLDQIFIEATKKQHNNYDQEKLIDELQKHIPSSARIREALKSKNLYEDNTVLIRYILVYLERQLRTNEDKVDFWEVTKGQKLIWSVEHIYPRTPKEGEWADDCKEWLHSLGNLTLTAYNSSLSNSSFEKKVNVKDDRGKDIGLKSGKVEINNYLRDKIKWTPEYIKERGKELENQFISQLSLVIKGED